MQVSNSETMAILLEVLGFRKNDYIPVGDKFELHIKPSDMAMAILNTGEDIQGIYGRKSEWKELTDYYQNQINDDLGNK